MRSVSAGRERSRVAGFDLGRFRAGHSGWVRAWMGWDGGLGLDRVGVIRGGHVQSRKGRDWSISVLINQALVRGCRVWF